MLLADADSDRLVKIAEALGFFAGSAVLVISLLRRKKTKGDEPFADPEEKPLPRLPLVGCFVVAFLLVLSGFVYVIVKHMF